MWLSGQQKQPVDSGEGQIGIVTMSGGETAVLLDCERRGLQVYSPGGYTWTPKVGHRVLVIRGQGEIPCVVGARQGQEVPDQVSIAAMQTTVRGGAVNISAQGGAEVSGVSVALNGQVYVNGETLEELITRIVMQILMSMGMG